MTQRESGTGETAGTGKLSSWPLFVALGLAVGEVGVVMAIYPLAIGGLVLFAGSVAGILTESGYAERPWRALTGLSGLFVLLGLVVVWTQTGTELSTVQNALASTDTVVLRGFSITGAGVVALAAGLAGSSITETSRAT